MYRTLNKPNPALLTDLEPSSLPALGEEPSSGQQGISTYFRERSKRHTLSMLLEHYTPMLDGDSSTSPSGSWSNPGFHGVPASPFSFCTSIMEPMPGLEQGSPSDACWYPQRDGLPLSCLHTSNFNVTFAAGAPQAPPHQLQSGGIEKTHPALFPPKMLCSPFPIFCIAAHAHGAASKQHAWSCHYMKGLTHPFSKGHADAFWNSRAASSSKHHPQLISA